MNIFELLKSFLPIPKLNISTIIKGSVLILIIGIVIIFLWKEHQLKNKLNTLKNQLQILQAENSKLKAQNRLLTDKLKNQKFEANISVQKVKTVDKIHQIKIQPKIKKINTDDQNISNKKPKEFKDTSETKSIKNLTPGNYHITIPIN